MPETWPTTISQDFAQDGYKEIPPDNLIKTENSVGAPKVRRRTTANVRKFQCSVEMLTTSQMADMETFFTTTCKEGLLSFTVKHPRTKAATTFWWSKPPEYTSHGATYDVQLSIEIRP